MYMCLLLPQNQLLCQRAAIPVMQMCTYVNTYTKFDRIERGLVGNLKPRTLKVANFLTKIHCISMFVSAAPKPGLVPTSRYTSNAAMSYINTYTKIE